MPSQGWCHPVRASPPSSLCLTHAQSQALLSFVPKNQRNSGLHGQSSLHAPKVTTEDQGSSLLATVLLPQFAQFAITGAGHLLPLGSHKHQAMSCPNALAGCAASLGASVSPLTSDVHHPRHKLRIPKANKHRVWRHHDLLCALEIGGLVRAEDRDLQRFLRSLQPGPLILPSWALVEPRAELTSARSASPSLSRIVKL